MPTRAYWRKYFCHGSQSNWHSGSRACGVSSVMEASKEARASRSHPRRTPVSLPPSLSCKEPSPSGDEARRHQERRASPTGGERGRVAQGGAGHRSVLPTILCRGMCQLVQKMCVPTVYESLQCRYKMEAGFSDRIFVCRPVKRASSVQMNCRLDVTTRYGCADRIWMC